MDKVFQTNGYKQTEKRVHVTEFYNAENDTYVYLLPQQKIRVVIEEELSKNIDLSEFVTKRYHNSNMKHLSMRDNGSGLIHYGTQVLIDSKAKLDVFLKIINTFFKNENMPESKTLKNVRFDRIFYQPVNTLQWNIFEEVKGIGHIEAFLATQDMQLGDLMVFHVGAQNKSYVSGIYAYGTIVKAPYIRQNHPEDYCNNKNSVDVRIDKIVYDTPMISHEEAKRFIRQFRSPHLIDSMNYSEMQELLGIFDEETMIESVEREISQVEGRVAESIVKIRVNQGVFRDRLLNRYNGCMLCNILDSRLLVASHIKPWALSDGQEKLDSDNGLLLCPNHDALFDGGYISFDDEGNILISNELSMGDRIKLNVRNDMRIPIFEGNKKYLQYHRENIFMK